MITGWQQGGNALSGNALSGNALVATLSSCRMHRGPRPRLHMGLSHHRRRTQRGSGGGEEDFGKSRNEVEEMTRKHTKFQKEKKKKKKKYETRTEKSEQ